MELSTRILYTVVVPITEGGVGGRVFHPTFEFNNRNIDIYRHRSTYFHYSVLSVFVLFHPSL